MREIKFRAWDKRNKKWVEAGQSLLGYLIAWISDYKFEILGRGDYEIVQYTGLKDKNGKEIYEGDIVEYRDMISGIKGKGVVKYENGSFCIDDGFKKAFRWIDYEVEKISNVFDNPELLEERGSIMPHAKRLK